MPFAAERKTSVGGAALEVIFLAGAKIGDIVFAVIDTEGAVPVSIVSAKATAENEVSVEFSADPSNDHVIGLVVYKPV
jgi:hypothetical protein